MTTPRTVIITGGSKGMGRDIARAFHRSGDDVIVASRSDNGFAREFPERMHFVACDVRRPDDLHTLVRDAAKSGCIVQVSMSLNCKDGVILFRIL